MSSLAVWAPSVSKRELACTVETFHDSCDNSDLRGTSRFRLSMLDLMLMRMCKIE